MVAKPQYFERRNGGIVMAEKIVRNAEKKVLEAVRERKAAPVWELLLI